MTDIAAISQNLQRFANAHKIVLEDHGEVGFGRPCVGFTHGNSYVDIHPLNMATYDRIWPDDDRLNAPSGVAAYHKHDCLAVLVDNDDYTEALCQLDVWVRHLESQGELEVVDYNTGVSGVQAMFSGVLGHALRFKAHD